MTKAVMTIHGFLTDTSDFGRLYNYLTFYDEVKACEIPGHNGKLDFAKFTVDSTLNAVFSCFDDLASRHDQVDIVGFSMGGALASYLCVKRKVGKVVLIAPANKYTNMASPFATFKFYSRVMIESYKATEGKLHDRVEALKDAISQHKQNANTSIKIMLNRLLPNISGHTFKVFRSLMNLVNDELEQQNLISNPCLILWGELDELVPRKSALYVEEHFFNEQLNVYNDVGHAMLLTNRDVELIPDIVSFLSNGKNKVTLKPRIASVNSRQR